MRRFHQILRVSGNGDGVLSEVLLEAPASGAVYAWLVRQEPGGDATGMVPILADGLRALDGYEAPPAEYRVAAEGTTTLTPSATDASFRTAFINAMPFHGGLRFVSNVTASGPYVLVVSVWGEQDTSP